MDILKPVILLMPFWCSFMCESDISELEEYKSRSLEKTSRRYLKTRLNIIHVVLTGLPVLKYTLWWQTQTPKQYVVLALKSLYSWQTWIALEFWIWVSLNLKLITSYLFSLALCVHLVNSEKFWIVQSRVLNPSVSRGSINFSYVLLSRRTWLNK